jgi:hypothetical protein
LKVNRAERREYLAANRGDAYAVNDELDVDKDGRLTALDFKKYDEGHLAGWGARLNDVAAGIDAATARASGAGDVQK